MRTCAMCKESKPPDVFRMRAGSKYRHSYCPPCEVIRQQHRYYGDLENQRGRSRDYMRRARQDPEKTARWNAAKQAKQASHYGPQQKIARQRIRAQRFFYYRAMILHGKDEPITARDLAHLWKQQRGRCALSGRKLGRDAHLDHKVPKSRRGRTILANLWWVSPEVNYAKRDMTVEEYVALCTTVAEWLGHRLVRANQFVERAA